MSRQARLSLLHGLLDRLGRCSSHLSTRVLTAAAAALGVIGVVGSDRCRLLDALHRRWRFLRRLPPPAPATAMQLPAAIGVAATPPVPVPRLFLTPPALPERLEDLEPAQLVVGYRPARRGGPRMEVEPVLDDAGAVAFLLAHNYGHSGGGWTTGVGCVLHVVDSLIMTRADVRDLLEQPVLVVGCGVIGLFTAITLRERGFRDVVILADQTEGIASTIAGGLLAPVKMGIAEDDVGLRRIMDGAEPATFDFFRALAAEGRPGGRFVDCFFDRHDPHGLDRYAAITSEDVVVEFPNGVQRELRRYTGNVFMDGPALMRDWHRRLEEQGVRVLTTDGRRGPLPPFNSRRFLPTLAAYGIRSPRLVMNASGYGSRYLCGDEAVYRLVGHLILLQEAFDPAQQWVLSDYLSADPSRAVYFHQKIHHLGCWMVGGTFIPLVEPPQPGGVDVNALTGEPVNHREEHRGVLERAKRYLRDLQR